MTTSTRDTLPEPVADLLDQRPPRLRAVVVTTDGGVDPRYFRADVERDTDELDRKASILASLGEEGVERTPFGAYRAGFRLYDDVAIARVSTADGSVVVSFDADGAATVEAMLTTLQGSDGSVRGSGGDRDH